MRKLFVILLAVSAPLQLLSQSKVLDEVEVTGRRPMKEIGIQKTKIDSLALKENITLSIADILTYNSSVFVKSYGRATLSTVSFRGTSPSHTQVTWNGMSMNNPMIGMTDFSTIPSFFIDKANLLYGTSSVNETAGGLGGLVQLGTTPEVREGFSAQYVQAAGSFSTFDEFGRISYGNDNWSVSTRASYSSSPNDYKYINHDKKVNIYDDDNNVIGQYYPTERNRSGAFRDLNVLQEVYYDNLRGDRFGLNAWYANSYRELPMLTTDYGEERDFRNYQKEESFRGVINWSHIRSKWKTELRAGYSYTRNAYDYQREITENNWAYMTRSRSYVHSIFGKADAEFSPNRSWLFTANLSATQHLVRSTDKSIKLIQGGSAIIGYDQQRIDFSAAASAKWQPSRFIGASVVLRQEFYGNDKAPVIPAFFVDGLILPAVNLTLKGSVSRNYRYPSLNDLYFLPGGNPDLKSEEGFTYDAGMSASYKFSDRFDIEGGLTWFDSYIDNWILWLPTNRGFFSPQNVKKVHSYGLEANAALKWAFARNWNLNISGTFSWTPSINDGEPMSPADNSVGKQLPYVPRRSSSFTGYLCWKGWNFMYKWCYYSQRYTMSSNDISYSGHLPAYFMSNIALEKGLRVGKVDLLFKFAVNNLFNEDYLSVLAHPMPGINYTGTVSITI